VSTLAKTIAKGLFRSLGLDVRRVHPFRVYEWLRAWNIRTVLDIGANTGQFAKYMHGLLPEAFIYSFEPLPQCYDELLRTMAQVRQFRGLPFALSDVCGHVPMYHNRFSPSSSLLPMEELHQEAFPHTRETSVEHVEVRRLDDVAKGLTLVDDVLVKIDVQGAELHVLRGADKTIARSSVLILETSFRPLYRGQPLFDAIYNHVRAKGYIFVGCESLIRDPRDGSILQCDAVFVRQGEGA
jgi:FkbM family methyltransferase